MKPKTFFKEGDTVVVKGPGHRFYNQIEHSNIDVGFEEGWVEDMDALIGQKLLVERVCDQHYVCRSIKGGCAWNYIAEWLEPATNMQESKQSKLGACIALASSVFADTLDKGGQPYILHCLQVMSRVGQTTQKEDVLCAAVLHDVIEDKPEYSEHVKHIGGHYVYYLVDLLSRKNGQTYEEFIDSIIDSNDVNAILIKMRDIEHNSDIRRLKGLRQKDFDRIIKYQKAYHKLEQALQLEGIWLEF